MSIGHGNSPSLTLDQQRERILAMQTELATLERDAPGDPCLELKRKALQQAYSTLGMTGLGE